MQFDGIGRNEPSLQTLESPQQSTTLLPHPEEGSQAQLVAKLSEHEAKLLEVF
jgi:hypothetical protein